MRYPVPAGSKQNMSKGILWLWSIIINFSNSHGFQKLKNLGIAGISEPISLFPTGFFQDTTPRIPLPMIGGPVFANSPSELQDNGVCYSCANTGFALWPLLVALAPRLKHQEKRWYVFFGLTKSEGFVFMMWFLKVSIKQLTNKYIYIVLSCRIM